MRIIITSISIGFVAILLLLIWYARITKFNGHYTFDIYDMRDKSTVVGSGKVVILNKLGGFNFLKRWPFVEHYNEVSGCRCEIKFSDGLIEQLRGVIITENIRMQISSGNYYGNGLFQYRVGQSMHDNKSVYINIDVGSKFGQLFLWSSTNSEGKQLGVIYELRKSD